MDIDKYRILLPTQTAQNESSYSRAVHYTIDALRAIINDCDIPPLPVNADLSPFSVTTIDNVAGLKPSPAAAAANAAAAAAATSSAKVSVKASPAGVQTSAATATVPTSPPAKKTNADIAWMSAQDMLDFGIFKDPAYAHLFPPSTTTQSSVGGPSTSTGLKPSAPAAAAGGGAATAGSSQSAAETTYDELESLWSTKPGISPSRMSSQSNNKPAATATPLVPPPPVAATGYVASLSSISEWICSCGVPNPTSLTKCMLCDSPPPPSSSLSSSSSSSSGGPSVSTVLQPAYTAATAATSYAKVAVKASTAAAAPTTKPLALSSRVPGYVASLSSISEWICSCGVPNPISLNKCMLCDSPPPPSPS
jgi:hypothetical protein